MVWYWRKRYPGVAKFGIALEWGSRGRWFESSHSDQKIWNLTISDFLFFQIVFIVFSSLISKNPQKSEQNRLVRISVGLSFYIYIFFLNSRGIFSFMEFVWNCTNCHMRFSNIFAQKEFAKNEMLHLLKSNIICKLSLLILPCRKQAEAFLSYVFSKTLYD